MKLRVAPLLACAVTAAAALAATAGAGTSSADATEQVSCKSTITLPLVTPVTGGAAILGTEQASWLRYAAKTLGPKYGLKIRAILADTPVEQGAGVAQTAAQRLIANKSVVAVIGPSTSGAVAASSQAYFDAGLAHISPSATRTSLTKGPRREATKAFFRVVPGDYIQGPSDARFMIDKLKVKKVVLVDFQEPYSQGLVETMDPLLKAKNVSTSRISIPNTVTDFSSFVTRVPTDADIVFFATQKPGDAQTFAKQLVEQGRRAKVFGGDGANNETSFNIPGAYVSNFAPDISGIKTSRAILAGWKKDNPGATLGSFGPPTYLAVQVALNAIKRACNKGNGTIENRRDVFRNVKRIFVKDSILGGNFRFSTKSNDPLNGKFYIFQIQSNGKYKLIG